VSSSVQIDEIVASIFSVTSSAPHLFGSRLGEFEQDLRQVLRRVSPVGRLCEVSQTIQLIIWTRPADNPVARSQETASNGG
jgi:hypothetical protein